MVFRETGHFCPLGCRDCRRNMERGDPVFNGVGFCPARKERANVAMAEKLRRTGPSNNGTGKETPPEDSEFSKKFPTLFAFLTETAWEGGDSREPGSVLIFTQEGSWKAMIKDKDSGQIAFVTKGTHKTLLEALERGLAEDKLDWREDAFKGKKKR